MRGKIVSLIVFCCFVTGICSSAFAEECGAQSLKNIVAKAGQSLQKMNGENGAAFQEKLKALKSLKGWSDKEFIAKAAPLVKNKVIAGFDTKNKAILAEINGLGQGAKEGAKGANCAMRDKLNSLLAQLVTNNKEKWLRMTHAVDQALSEARAATN